jgi:AmmeMemoRadiSam system protein B
VSSVRAPAVAGVFYPEDAEELRAQVEDLLAGAARAPVPAPKALIAPHAGYVYSGPVAASAYACLAAARSRIRRVLLLGPAHRVGFRGLACPSAEWFETPLGRVPLDRDALAAIAELRGVRVRDDAHEDEHSLEVHLPFLQALLRDFTLVPLAVGDATAEEVGAVIERLWGGPETVIVVSSDLSHYRSYEEAQRLDRRTSRAIESLRYEDIGYDDACGRAPVAGLLYVARARGLGARTVDLRNSGDTAGPRGRVVGYGAYALQ